MSNADKFLKKMLGEDFFESLAKVELWKPGTKSTIDHEELRTALQIVPRTIIALLIRELVPMQIGETKEVPLFCGINALMRVTKHERDVYSGDLEEDNKKVVEFKLRALPGVGLVIMSAFELYDMENLINSPSPMPPVETPAEPQELIPPGAVPAANFCPTPDPRMMPDADLKIQHLIDERMALHELVGRVIDKKIIEREAVHEMVLSKLTEAIRLVNEKANALNEKIDMVEVKAEVAKSIAKKASKKNRPLSSFLEKKKQKVFSIPLHMTKGEKIECPDCGKNIFQGPVFSGCICLGDDRERKIFIKKSEDGVNVRFSRGWDPENIEMLLEVLKKR
jgi:hypothetical protein